MKVLILFAHPAFQKSKANRELLKGIRNLENVTFHDLYENYPDFDINIQREQELLVEHDFIIFHHPLFWYNTPALLKEWQDLVLEHGWAYGSRGKMLTGKLFCNVITTGGPQQVYQHDGLHKHTIRELIAPITQTANFCNMITLPPFVVHGSYAMSEDELKVHRTHYHNLLKFIASGRLNPDEALRLEYLNDYICVEVN